MRLVLIGCSKTKKVSKPQRHRVTRFTPTELYGGDLFRKRVDYAERRQLDWAVLSAQHGVWHPHISLPWYDYTMAQMNPSERAQWHVGVANTLIGELWEPWDNGKMNRPLRPSELTIEIHAGKDYSQPLAAILQSLGVKVETPCQGLGIGQQLALYTSGSLSTAA